MIDILYLAHNRREFTEATIAALRKNTDWSLVRSVMLYDDRSTDGAREFLAEQKFPVETHFRPGNYGGPAAVMNDAICSVHPEAMIAKLDSDTMVPPGWLGDCVGVMRANPNLDLLGIEAHYEVEPAPRVRSFAPAEYIGGIGLMRCSAFTTLPRPNQRFYGFTAWQTCTLVPTGFGGKRPVAPGWLKPSLPVFLLDRMPLDPWVEINARYVAEKWQRPWPKYDPVKHAYLWEWWKS